MIFSIRDKFIKSIGWSALDQWGTRILSFVVLSILARLLEPHSFGILAVALVFTDYLEMFVSQGIGFSIIQRKELEKEHLNVAFWLNLGSGVLLGLLLLIVAPLIAKPFGKAELTKVLQSLSPLLLISGISRVQAAILTRELKFKALAIRNLSGRIAGGAVGIILAYKGFGVWSLVWMTVVGATVGSAVLWLTSDWRPGFSVNMRCTKDIYKYSIKIFADQQVIYFSNRLDEGLIGYFLDVSTLGIYSMGKKLVVLLIDSINSTLGMVVFPIFSKIQDDTQRLIKSLLFGSKYYLAVTIPIYLGLATFAQDVIVFMFGNQWAQAAVTITFLSISAPFQFTPLLIHATFQAIGGPGVPLTLNILRALLSLILFPIGALYGLNGVAAAVMIKNIMAANADIIALKIKLSVRTKIFFSQAKLPLISSIIAVIISKVFLLVTSHVLGRDLALVIAAFIGALSFAVIIMISDQTLIRDIVNIFKGPKTNSGKVAI